MVYPADVVLFEGILVFYSQELRDMFHLRLFVDTDSDVRLSRRGEGGWRGVLGVVRHDPECARAEGLATPGMTPYLVSPPPQSSETCSEGGTWSRS